MFSRAILTIIIILLASNSLTSAFFHSIRPLQQTTSISRVAVSSYGPQQHLFTNTKYVGTKFSLTEQLRPFSCQPRCQRLSASTGIVANHLNVRSQKLPTILQAIAVFCGQLISPIIGGGILAGGLHAITGIT